MDYKKNNKYFETYSYKKQIYYIIIGIFIEITAFIKIPKEILSFKIPEDIYHYYEQIDIRILIVLGITIVIGQLTVIITRCQISDQEYDASVKSELNNIDERIMKKIKEDPDNITDVKPITVGCYNFDESKNLKSKRGKDNRFRSNWYNVISVVATREIIYFYFYNYCCTEKLNTENVNTIFLNDITRFESSSSIVDVNGEKLKIGSLKIFVSGIEATEISMIEDSDTHRSFEAITQLIKQKKQEK